MFNILKLSDARFSWYLNFTENIVISCVRKHSTYIRKNITDQVCMLVHFNWHTTNLTGRIVPASSQHFSENTLHYTNANILTTTATS
jgi:hypothetical protein